MPREHTGHRKHSLPTTQDMSLHMEITRWSVTKAKLMIFFAAKDGEVIYSHGKQDLEPTVAQIIQSYCKIQAQIEECMENH